MFVMTISLCYYHLQAAALHVLLLCTSAVDAFSTTSSSVVVPEVNPTHLAKVSQLVQAALGDRDDTTNRYELARDAVSDFQTNDDSPPSNNELVYGELSVEVLATILDAVGVKENDVFLDIGSGDGALVLGASLLYADASCNRNNAMNTCYGVDIVPGLVERSKEHANNLHEILHDVDTSDGESDNAFLRKNQAEMHFILGDIHQPNNELRYILKETTLAVCFATTWSAGNASGTSLKGRKLPKLSKALSPGLRSGCRVVIIDGKLDEDDDFCWKGDLIVKCPDTAPYSVASLYHKQ